MTRVLALAAPYKWVLLQILFLGLVVAAIQPVCVRLVEKIVDSLQAGVGQDFFTKIPVVLIGIFLVSGLAKYFYNTLRRYTAERVIVQLREQLFEKYLVLPMKDLQAKSTGNLLSRIQNDLVQINMGLETICDMLKEPFVFLGLMGVAFYCDWRLAMVTITVAPLVVYFFSRSGAAVKRYSIRNLGHFSELVSLIEESLVGAHVVRVFRLEATLSKKFQIIQEKYLKNLLKSIRVQELATPGVELIGAILMSVVLVYGGYRIENGWLTSGQLIAFVIALGLAQMPIKQLNNAFLKLKAAEAAAERVYEILDLDLSRSPAVSSRKTAFEREIRFENVFLRYGDKAALEGIDFEVQKGECVAFVGQSGSGKSSLVNLLTRLYEIQGGAIWIDGQDIRNIPLADLRRLISFVTQDTFLFNDSILENIRFGRLDATVSEVERAAELAHCNEFLRRFPLGIETPVGDRGACLSGGERQRVAIARAILKGAPILVLDEATSNLDSTSESLVQEALETLMQSKTTLVVAHRLSTIRRADRIYVLEGGKIFEQGTHQQLLGQKGRYQKLFEKQAGLPQYLS